MNEEHMAYIGRADCGCIKLAIVDNPEHIKETAKEISKALRQGYRVERVTCEYVRQNWDCPEHKKVIPLAEALKGETLKSGKDGE